MPGFLSQLLYVLFHLIFPSGSPRLGFNLGWSLGLALDRYSMVRDVSPSESFHPIRAFWKDSPQRASTTCPALSLSGKLKSATEEGARGQWTGQLHRLDHCRDVLGQSLKNPVNIIPRHVVKYCGDINQAWGSPSPLVPRLAGDSCTNRGGL